MDLADMPEATPDVAPNVDTAPQTTQRSLAQHAGHTRRSPRRRHIAGQYLRFCVVGLSNALVDLGALNLLLLARPTRSEISLIGYNTVAVALAILNSYLWNTRWTFQGEATKSPRERALFIGQAILNIAINNIVLLVMTGVFPSSTGEWSLFTANLAKLAAMVVASTMSFLLLRAIVFRPRA